jgi:YD repeat-containing protein
LQSGIVKGSGTSGSNGSYSISGLVSGTYDVRASASLYFSQTQNGVVVSAPSSTTANFSLVEAGPFTNIYDEVGRLVAVVDPTGDTVRYSYDAVGNLLSITRASSSSLSVIEFTPDKGPVGSSVTIFGTGFSTTPGNNTVKFNGTTATVTSSSATQISTTVPVGATTGLISVTTAAGTASSSVPFTVGSDAPIITSFTPNIGVAGTIVNLSGSNFDTTPSGNRVAFNGTRSVVTAATATSITTSVPAGARSGRISDTTATGTGTSNDYFLSHQRR